MPYSNENPPVRSGDYTRFIARKPVALVPSAGSTVALCLTDDWGPEKVVTRVGSFAEYLKLFGQPIGTAYSSGFVAAYNAFKGEGATRPGAGSLLVYRMVGSAGAPATHTLLAGSNSIVLTAKYKGTLGNSLSAEVVVNALDNTARDIRLYLNGVKVEEYFGYTAAQLTNAQADINAKSTWVVASGAANGTVLAAAAAAAFIGGNSGTTLVSGDYTTAATAFEPWEFGAFCVHDLTDGSIKTALHTWASGLNSAEKAKRFFTVFGGALAEVYSAATTEANTFADENTVRFGVGTYHDTMLNRDLSTAQLAPRLAGIIVANGGRASISFARLSDLTLVAGPTDSEAVSAYSGGVVVATLGQNGVVHLESPRTTWTQDTEAKPFNIYSRIKYVATMQSFERDVRAKTENGEVIGKLPVNDDTREFLMSEAQTLLDNDYIQTNQVQRGAKVTIATTPPPDDNDEFVALDYQVGFGRAVEQIRRTMYVS